jgi:hypothetical protein
VLYPQEKEFNMSTAITRAAVKTFRTDLNEVLREFSEKHGFTAEIGTITYSSNQFHFKTTISAETTDGISGKHRDDFKRYASRHGFQRDECGAEFMMDGVLCQVISIIPRARRSQMLVKKGTKMTRMEPRIVRHHLDKIGL